MSWRPLCGNEDPPFRGDPDALDHGATLLKSIATGLKEQAVQLQSYVDNTGSWSGPAKDACVKTVSGLPRQLSSAGLKYQSAGDSLAPYASSLRDAMHRAESLRVQAEQAQSQIDHYDKALHDQHTWEKNEQKRAAHAVADPSLGSPFAAHWPGQNNAGLLADAKHHLDDLRRQLDGVRANLKSAASAATSGINAAAEVVHDDGGLVGFFSHTKTEITQGAKKVVKWASEHGIDLAALSETLGKLAGWLSLIAMLPIPGAQIFGAIGMVVGAAGLLVGLVLVLAGEKSFGGWALDVGLTLLPFAAKGLRAGALARSASKGDEASKVAKNLIGQTGVNGKPLIKNATTLLDDADSFKSGIVNNKVIQLLHIDSTVKPLTGLKLDTFGSKLLTGRVAENSATKVIKMSATGVRGVIGTGLHIVEEGNDFREHYNSVVDLKDAVLSVVGIEPPSHVVQ